MNTTIAWLQQPIKTPDQAARTAALARQGQLTKPPGALGKLEELAVQFAAFQGVEKPQLKNISIGIFAGDHGVAAENVSAFPQAVTAEMVKNFARGGAAICVAAREIAATLEVINLGTAFDTGVLPNVRDYQLGKGTANFVKVAAMEEAQLAAALAAGHECATRAARRSTQLFIGGEMGIANTTSAAAIACALLQLSPAKLAGPGTGLDVKGVAHKADVIARALAFHTPHLHEPLEILRRLGGFEIAALTGAFIAAAQHGVPVLVDGYITTAAALLAVRINPELRPWLLFAHRSAEPAHQLMLEALHAQPLLDLGMRLGEGSGAAVTIPLLRMACALHNEMATFAEAGVSEKS